MEEDPQRVPSETQIVEKETIKTSSPVQSSTKVLEQEVPKDEEPKKKRKYRRVRRKKKEEDLIPKEMMEIEGVRTIVLSPPMQHSVKCLVGEHVTAENPWKYILKEDLEDNLELHEESSEFLPLKEEIILYPREEILVIYIPDEAREYDEFYICLTEPAEKAVSLIIANILKEREERLNNSIFKTVGPWTTLGSETEIDEMQLKNNRPLLEVEVETEYPVMQTKNQFKLRLVQHAIDGYMELLAPRQTFTNLLKRRITVPVQVTPYVVENEAQTIYAFPKHAITQYEFQYDPIRKLSKEFEQSIKSFMTNDMDSLDDTIYVNSYINFYTNDYQELVRDNRFTCVPQVSSIKDYGSLACPRLCGQKEIACTSWHPMWTGTIAIGYCDHKSCDYKKFDPNLDVVAKALYDVTPVLLWSFKDLLEPKLLLETAREASVLSFCPYDENILVGGCISGQIVVWDLTNKLKGVEEEEILTDAQRRYRMLLNTKMTWMKNTKDLKVVPTTVVSELEYSHRGIVTSIKWVSPYREISLSGQVTDIPEDEDRTSLQFISSSLDGTILMWDLRAKPSYTSSYKPRRTLRRLKKRPSALTMAVSPLRVLNRLMKPIFKVNVLAANSTRNLPLTELNLVVTKMEYEETYPDPNRKFNITDRILYKPILQRPRDPRVNRVAAGTTEGDFLIAVWEGFDFNAGEVVNKETCQFMNFAKYHDGPVVSIARSEVYQDLLLTVGGKIFALWKNDFIGRPVMWRRSTFRYTHGIWNNFRPSIFRLSRIDGNIELWHLKNRSDRYIDLLPISAESIGDTSTHPLPMKQNVMGVVCGRGNYRLFHIAHNMMLATEFEKSSTYNLCTRQAEIKTKIMNWQEQWLLKHADQIKENQEKELIIRKEKEEQLKREKEELLVQEEALKQEKDKLEAQLLTPEPGHYAEWARQQWMIREKERLMTVLLSQKALDIEVLRKQQLPLLKMEEEQNKKKRKQEHRLSVGKKLFDDAVAMSFPETVAKKPPKVQDPYAGGDSSDVKILHYENFTQTVKKCEEYVNERKYQYYFHWNSVIEAGRERRKILDGAYNRHVRKRTEKLKKQKEGDSDSLGMESTESHASLGSIDYRVSLEDANEQNEPEENAEASEEQ